MPVVGKSEASREVLLKKLKLAPGDVTVRFRFGRVCAQEAGCLAVEAEIKKVVGADLTLETEGASADVRGVQRAVCDASQRGLSNEDAAKSLATLEVPWSKKLGKRGGAGYFYIVDFLDEPREAVAVPVANSTESG